MSKLTGKNALIAGDDQSIKVTAPFNLTGYTVTFTVKSPTALASNSDAGATIQVIVNPPVSTDTTNGICYVPLTAAQTRVAAGKYVYDIQFLSPSSKKVSTPKQDIEFVDDVTKA